MKKLLVSGLLLGFGVVSSMAQSGTKSPYSQYGLGVLSDQSQGFNRGMAGLFQGLRSGNQVNMQNPASYSAVDSLSMIVDLGVSGTLTNFKEGDAKVNAKTANFEYATALVPYSNIGYSYSTKQNVGTSSTISTTSFEGKGGFRQAYIGLGYELFKGLSLGVNFSYFWGDFSRKITVASSDAYVKTLAKEYSADASSYKLDFGAQYQHKLGQNDLLTVGATLGLGHKINADPCLSVTNLDTQTNIVAVSVDTVYNGLSMSVPTISGSDGVKSRSPLSTRLTISSNCRTITIPTAIR